MDAIDNAIANVVARKASENNAFSTSLKIDNEQERIRRNEKHLQKEQERAAKKAEKLAKKQAFTEDNKPSRLEKAYSKLPLLTDAAKEILEIVQKESTATIADIISHLQYTIKTRAEKKPRIHKVGETHFKVGDHVKINASENEHHIGLVGKVVDIKRIRCLIKIGKYKNPVAAYHNDVEVVNINVSSNEVEEDNEKADINNEVVETTVEDENTEVETIVEDNEDEDSDNEDEEELTEENSSLLRWLAKPQESNVTSEETDEECNEVEE